MYNPTDSEKYPIRKNPRLSQFDYSSANTYFITICTDQKRCIFGKTGNLNASGRVAREGFDKIPEHYPGVTVEKCVVMPNHVHAILTLSGNGASVPTVISSYKSYVTKRIHEEYPALKVWQTSFHDHVIRNRQSYEKIWLYIDGNPQKWEEDCFYCL